MSTDDQQDSQSVGSSIAIFFRGFFIRLLYGSLAIPILLLVRPDFITEDASPLVFGSCAYLVVCVLGGAYDAATKQTRKLKLWGKPKLRDVILLILLIVSLLLVR